MIGTAPMRAVGTAVRSIRSGSFGRPNRQPSTVNAHAAGGALDDPGGVSTSRALRSFIFFLAISLTCFLVTLKPLYLPPFLAFSSAGDHFLALLLLGGDLAACLSSTAAGGLLILNSKLRSE